MSDYSSESAEQTSASASTTPVPGPVPSVPPASPALAAAIAATNEELAYHEKRMGKRLRRLKGESPWDEDEMPTGVCAVVPDPFPTRAPLLQPRKA